MSGRRINPPEQVRADLQRACDLAWRAEVPLDLQEWALAAAINFVGLPPRFQDEDQFLSDLKEASDLARELDHPIAFRRQIAEAALQRISVREHIVAMPGSQN